MEKLVYRESGHITEEEFKQAINSKNRSVRINAIVDAVYSILDDDFLIPEYSKLLKDKDYMIRRNVVTCLGIMADFYYYPNRQQLLDLVKPLLLDEKVKYYAEDAMEQINHQCDLKEKKNKLKKE